MTQHSIKTEELAILLLLHWWCAATEIYSFLNTQHTARFWVTFFVYFVSTKHRQFINVTIITARYTARLGPYSFQFTKLLSHPLLEHHPTSIYPQRLYGKCLEGVLFRLICGRLVRHLHFSLVLSSKLKISSCSLAVF